MKFADLALLAVGIVGVLMGFAGLWAHRDVVNIVLAVLQLAAGGLSLLVVLKSFRASQQRQPEER